jgi:hypothetical protein
MTDARAERREGGGASRACAACGAEARRDSARFCSTCGRELGADYFPTDTLRASYHFEGRPAASRVRLRERPAARRGAAGGRWKGEFSMSARGNNGAAATALAFVTYALVPYIGILFCPGALLMGGLGLLRSYRAPKPTGRRASALAILLGLLVLCVQLLLWWVLYKVPEWSGGGSNQ